jgi:hypothetical protein
MRSRVVCSVATEVSEEHIASIFRVEEIISARTSKQASGKQNKLLAGKPASVATQRTTRRHILEDDALHNHRCENLKSYKIFLSVISPTRDTFSSRPNFPGLATATPLHEEHKVLSSSLYVQVQVLVCLATGP